MLNHRTGFATAALVAALFMHVGTARAQCVPACGSHGTCMPGNVCACDPGYTGNVCQYSNAVTCNNHGTANFNGTCTCFVGYTGTSCQSCATNYYNYPTCTFCQSGTTCSGHGSCTGTGSCACFVGFVGANCNQCGPNYYNYPTCTYCLASTTCSGNGTCTSTGACACNTGFAGANCNQCAANYYNFPTCTYCNAATTCSGNGVCTSNGSCACNVGWTGVDCSIPPPAVITQWRSVRSHSGIGELPIVLNGTATGNGVSGPSVETRQGGIQKIEVVFDRPVTMGLFNVAMLGQTTTGGVMGTPVAYLPVAAGISGGNTLWIQFAPGFLPDQTCYTLIIGSSTVVGGIAGDNTVSIRSLFGDTNPSGDVVLGDVLFTKSKVTAGATAAANPSHDVNTSGGLITLGDVLAVKSQAVSPVHQALCP